MAEQTAIILSVIKQVELDLKLEQSGKMYLPS